jgi:hypothetical protein
MDLTEEDPSRTPEPILSKYLKQRDARYDLMALVVDGRLSGGAWLLSWLPSGSIQQPHDHAWDLP